jgi:uncharacterized membrane protein
VVAAALTAGLAAGLPPLEVLAAFGKAFNTNRYVTIAWLVLPAIGVLERCGLQERARMAIQGLKAASAGKVLLTYLVLRQLTAALGLTNVAGQAQTVRPLRRADGRSGRRDHGRRWRTTIASGSRRCRPPPTMSGCSSARTSSWPSARSC